MNDQSIYFFLVLISHFAELALFLYCCGMEVSFLPRSNWQKEINRPLTPSFPLQLATSEFVSTSSREKGRELEIRD